METLRGWHINLLDRANLQAKYARAIFPNSDGMNQTTEWLRKQACDRAKIQWIRRFHAPHQEPFMRGNKRYTGRRFLHLMDKYPTKPGSQPKKIIPDYTNGGTYMKLNESLAYDPKIMARFTRCITAHAPIGEYRRDFAPPLDFACPCGHSLYESRDHVILRCPRFLRKLPGAHLYADSLADFLKDNPGAFEFLDRHEGNYDPSPPASPFSPSPGGPTAPGNGADNQSVDNNLGRQRNAQQRDPHLFHRSASCHRRHANPSIPPPLCCEQEDQERPSQSPIDETLSEPQEGTGRTPTDLGTRGLPARGIPGRGKGESQHLSNALAAEICHANIASITARFQGAMELGDRTMPSCL